VQNWKWSLSRNLNREENLAYTFKWLPQDYNSFSVEGCYNLLCGLHNFGEYSDDFMAAAHR